MSISFDRAADFYDETRGYPPGVGERVGRALLEAAGATPEIRLLELGVGTGRIALPIIRAGYRYTGVDISPRMMSRLRAALAEIPGATERVTLVEGDATALPFADRSFDVVLAVHVFHLVSDRARAVAESVRVLARPGVVLAGEDDVADDDPSHEASAVWREILLGLGWPAPSTEEREEARSVVGEWQRLGGVVDRFVAVEEARPWTPARYVEGMERRLWSSTWAVPDDIYPEAVRRLHAWANRHYGAALHTPLPSRWRFVIACGRFPGPSG
jgi:SAM-dependent methyltransferase